MNTYYLWQNDEAKGPFSAEQLADVPGGTLVSSDQGKTWVDIVVLRQQQALPSVTIQRPSAEALASVTRPPHAPAAALPGAAAPAGSAEALEDDLEEKVIWEGHPSHWAFMYEYLLRFLLACAFGAICFACYLFSHIPAFVIGSIAAFAAFVVSLIFLAAKVIEAYNLSYKLTNQRLQIRRGLISTQVNELELFRLRDTSANQTVGERLFGIGNIWITAADTDMPRLCIYGVANPTELRETIRALSMKARRMHNVRNLDVP
ncbi:MAG: PH domain-containing protein [Candidatus Methylacidiphilales bacterium]|nr:PH domain-containing protein [Candidatus Methylacidiphilales bacterium]